MKLEKFNLEKALNGAKIVTRDGREVTQLTKFKDAEDYPLGAVLEGKIQSWNTDGYCYREEESDTDLFLAVKVQSAWVNIYRHSNRIDMLISGTYKTKEVAIKNISEDWEYIKTIEITDEI